MTTLGKTLVFVNLAFSLITGAFIVTAFVTRTNWKADRDRIAKELEVVKADRKAWIFDVEREKNERTQKVTALEGQLKAATDDCDRIKKQSNDFQQQLAKANERFNRKDTDSSSAATQLSRLQMEVAQLHTDLTGRDQTINKLEGEKRVFRDQEVTAKLSLKSAEDRNTSLLAQLETLSREIERLRATPGAPAGPAGMSVWQKAPPPEDVRGIVKATDPESGLVTISIGSDAGINKGHTLEVYRLRPKPTYVGTMRIDAVRPNEAVGKLIANQRRGTVLVGDEVASEIMGRR